MLHFLTTTVYVGRQKFRANSYPLNNIFWTPFAPVLVLSPLPYVVKHNDATPNYMCVLKPGALTKRGGVAAEIPTLDLDKISRHLTGFIPSPHPETVNPKFLHRNHHISTT